MCGNVLNYEKGYNMCDYRELELCSACAFRFTCKIYKQKVWNDKKRGGVCENGSNKT